MGVDVGAGVGEKVETGVGIDVGIGDGVIKSKGVAVISGTGDRVTIGDGELLDVASVTGDIVIMGEGDEVDDVIGSGERKELGTDVGFISGVGEISDRGIGVVVFSIGEVKAIGLLKLHPCKDAVRAADKAILRDRFLVKIVL